MNKPYNVDDILNEIKAKKARSARPARPAPARPAENPAPARPETSTATAPRPAEPAPQPEAQQQQPPRQPRPSEQPQPRPQQQPKQQQRPDPMDSTGVFFSSLSNHRETVREEQERLEKERQERERLEAQRREQQRLEQQRKEAELREQQRQEQERARLQQEELTDSFFLEQQPADLPPKEAATPFGDIEPTTPPPEQPDPNLQDKTEYQKYFSSLGRKKKNAPKPEKQPEPQPEQSIAEMVIANFMPGMPVMSLYFMPAGALAASSSVRATGRITACGQT